MTAPYIPADPAKLPLGWQNDVDYREGVYRTIRGLLREGHSQYEVARRIGCSDRTVNRIANRTTDWVKGPITARCGAERVVQVYNHLLRTTTVVPIGLTCQGAVKRPGDRCSRHQ